MSTSFFVSCFKFFIGSYYFILITYCSVFIIVMLLISVSRDWLCLGDNSVRSVDFIGLNGETVVGSWLAILTLTRLCCFSRGAGIWLVAAYLILTCLGGKLLFFKVLFARAYLKL